jgi:hypothetical protein
MTLHKITLGDYCNDGHGMKETCIIEIPNHITYNQLKENYKANIATIGFSPSAFANRHEDSSIHQNYVETLKQNGLKVIYVDQIEGYLPQAYFTNGTEEFQRTLLLEESHKENSYRLDTDNMLKIVLHYFGHGLENFSWKNYTFENPELLGISSEIENDVIGYGLFHN